MKRLLDKPIGVWVILILATLSSIAYFLDMSSLFSAMRKYDGYEVLLIFRILKIIAHILLVYYLFMMHKKSIRVAQITFAVVIITNIFWRILLIFILQYMFECGNKHFLRKQIIFTDGFAPSGFYETIREDESSSEFGTVYTKIFIETDTDEIRFPARGGGYFATIAESDSTNMLAGQILGEGQQTTFPVLLNNAVVHKLDKALLINELEVSQ